MQSYSQNFEWVWSTCKHNQPIENESPFWCLGAKVLIEIGKGLASFPTVVVHWTKMATSAKMKYMKAVIFLLLIGSGVCGEKKDEDRKGHYFKR